MKKRPPIVNSYWRPFFLGPEIWQGYKIETGINLGEVSLLIDGWPTTDQPKPNKLRL